MKHKHILLLLLEISENCGVLVRGKTTLVPAARLTAIRRTGHPVCRSVLTSEFGVFFVVLRTACFSVQGQRGGCAGKKRGGVPAPLSLKSFVFCGLSLVIGFPRADTEKSGETIATPPKTGGHAAPIAALSTVPLSGPRGSLSSVFIPAGRLGKDAPKRRSFALRRFAPFPS